MFHTNILILFIIISQCGANFLPEAVQSPDIFRPEEEDTQGAGTSTSHKKIRSTTAKTHHKKKRPEDISLDFSELPDEAIDEKAAKDKDDDDSNKGVIDLDFEEIPNDYDDYDEEDETTTKPSKTTKKYPGNDPEHQAPDMSPEKDRKSIQLSKFKDVSAEDEAEELFSTDSTNYSSDYDLELIKRELLDEDDDYSNPGAEDEETPETSARSSIDQEPPTTTIIKFEKCPHRKRIKAEDNTEKNFILTDSQIVDKLMLDLYKIIPV